MPSIPYSSHFWGTSFSTRWRIISPLSRPAHPLHNLDFMQSSAKCRMEKLSADSAALASFLKNHRTPSITATENSDYLHKDGETVFSHNGDGNQRINVFRDQFVLLELFLCFSHSISTCRCQTRFLPGKVHCHSDPSKWFSNPPGERKVLWLCVLNAQLSHKYFIALCCRCGELLHSACWYHD